MCPPRRFNPGVDINMSRCDGALFDVIVVDGIQAADNLLLV